MKLMLAENTVTKIESNGLRKLKVMGCAKLCKKLQKLNLQSPKISVCGLKVVQNEWKGHLVANYKIS